MTAGNVSMFTMSRARAAVAFAAFFGMSVTGYPVIYCSFPQLLQPVSNEFGWGRSAMPLALLIAAPVGTLLYPLVGWSLDRWGSRRVLLLGFLLLGLFMSSLSLMTGSVPQMLVLYVCTAACGTLPTGVAFGRVVARNFDVNRGLVLGICLGIGGGLGAAIMPEFTQFLLDHGGWRQAYLGIGLAPILVGCSAAFFLPTDARSRRTGGTAPAATPAGSVRLDRTFLLLIGITFSSCMVINGLAAHLAAIAADHGLSSSTAALLLSVFALSMMAGQFGVGLCLDRVQTPRLALPVFCALVAGVVQLQFATTETSLMAGVALLGLGAGSEYALLPYFVSRFFGLSRFGFLYGLIYAASAFGSGFGPYAMGAAFDMAGSYGRAMIGFELIGIGALVLAAYLPRYTYAPDGSLLPV